jgi:hypothetical protein
MSEYSRYQALPAAPPEDGVLYIAPPLSHTRSVAEKPSSEHGSRALNRETELAANKRQIAISVASRARVCIEVVSSWDGCDPA